MATYLTLNLLFLLVIILALRPWRYLRAWRPLLLALVVLLLLTAVFDNLIIHFGIVGYDQLKILGLHIGIAPVEDFFYSILAVFLIPTLWHILKGKS